VSDFYGFHALYTLDLCLIYAWSMVVVADMARGICR